MSRARFFVERELNPGSSGTLDADQAKQLRSVLRARPGDSVVLVNGGGEEAVAVLVSLTGRLASYQVRSVDRPNREPGRQLTCGLALIKPQRFEMAVQKLTELGVSHIVPLVADRNVVMLESSDDWNRRAARLQRIMIEAAEQSERTTIPELNGPTTLADFLATPGVVALVERSEGKPLLSVLPAALNSVSLAVGPEGGWSLRERDLIQRLSVPATLGSLILRAETAAIAAASAIFQDDLAHQERSS